MTCMHSLWGRLKSDGELSDSVQDSMGNITSSAILTFQVHACMTSS